MREKLIELLNNSFEEQYSKRGLLTAPHTADHLITNGVTVQKRGWIKIYSDAFYPYSCSECGSCHGRKVNFCSNCGTKLDLPEPPQGE